MTQRDELITAVFDTAKFSTLGLFLAGTDEGKHELAEMIRHIAAIIEYDSPTYQDCFALMNEMAAWNMAKFRSPKRVAGGGLG